MSDTPATPAAPAASPKTHPARHYRRQALRSAEQLLDHVSLTPKQAKLTCAFIVALAKQEQREEGGE